jgi:hypothetical protein
METAMKAKVPVIVKDPEVSAYKDIAPTEEITVDETTFLDGPISTTVAVLDFDPSSGALAPAVRWQPGPDGKEGRYLVDRPLRPGDASVDPPAAAVSVFGAVHKTIQMFEEKDALGRPVRWAFGAPQLLVVPRAGEWPNAYYERETHSVQLFQFRAPNGREVFTSHSQDIVAHEVAHAILDGIAPDLYGAITPQSLAIHEAVADMAALLASLRCRELTRRVLDDTRGDIRRSTVFSGLAEQFAGGLGQGSPYLRNLDNDRSLCAGAPEAARVDRSEPHALSEILTGALYRTLQGVYAELRAEYERTDVASERLASRAEQAFVAERVKSVVRRDSRSPEDARAKALFVASERLKRMLLRGLDYLPPGDVTFADLGRAILASDEASHPQAGAQRAAFAKELVDRCVVASAAQLRVRTNYRHRALEGIDVESLVESDYVAYGFANRNRDLLRIPKGIPFEVRPRLDVTKLYWHRGDEQVEVRECLFKVAWTETEENKVGRGLPRERRWVAGTTLAIEWSASPRVRAILTTGRRSAQERRDTDALIRTLVDSDVLQMGEAAIGPNGVPLRGAVPADAPGGVLRIRNAGRMLHVTRER